MTHMTKDLDGICDMKDSLMRKVRGKMDDHDPGRAAQPPQDGRRDHVEGRHSRATQAHQGESHQVVDHVDRLMRR